MPPATPLSRRLPVVPTIVNDAGSLDHTARSCIDFMITRLTRTLHPRQLLRRVLSDAERGDLTAALTTSLAGAVIVRPPFQLAD